MKTQEELQAAVRRAEDAVEKAREEYHDACDEASMVGCVFEDRADDLLLAKDALAKFLNDL